MPTSLQTLKASDATAIILTEDCRAVLAQQSNEQSAAGAGGAFDMLLYTGAVFSGSYRWGNVVLDVAGFKPHRKDVAAMLNHYEPVGAVADYETDPAKGIIRCTGKLLQGTETQEPAANKVQRRLQQKFPYQASGRYQPIKVEQIEAGIPVTINGRKYTGPLTIFREFTNLEASFTEMGWDPMTKAVAAKADEAATIQVEVTATQPQQENRSMNATLLTSLQKIVGAEQAIVLATAKPEAADLSAFAQDFANLITAQATEIGTLKTKLSEQEKTITAKAGEIDTLKSELATAKKAPVVVVAGKDPSKPEAEGQPVVEASDAAYGKEFDEDANIQAQMPDRASYIVYRRKGGEKPA